MTTTEELTKGLSVTSESGRPHEAWRLFTTAAPEAFRAAMTQGLPPGTKLEIILDESGRLQNISFNYFRKDLADGRKEFFGIDRSIFYRDSPIVALGNTDMSDNLQGRGINRLIDGRVFGLYLQQGVDLVKMSATKINCYAAARRGFVPDEKESFTPEEALKYQWKSQWNRIRGLVVGKLDYLEAYLAPVFGPVPLQASDAIREGAAMASPKGMWKIVDEQTPYAGIPLGKLVTIAENYLPPHLRQALKKPQDEPSPFNQGEGWRGYLDLKNDDFLNRARAYLGVPLVRPPTALRAALTGLLSPFRRQS